MDHILSVCSGIGGLDLGFADGLKAIGREPRTMCMVEREAFCCSVLGKAMQQGKLDNCPIWCGDLAELPLSTLPRIDWYIGGVPCQPFSHAGQRRGKDDRRHLWPIVREQLTVLKPRGVFFENVAGMLTLGLRDLLADLEGIGFRCAFGVYSAAEIGAPHRRDRVFILGLADPDPEELAPPHDDHRGHALRDIAGRRHKALADTNGQRGRLRDAEWKDAADAWKPPRDSWPARPGQQQALWEPFRTQPAVRRGTHGLSDRVDRLRALGNAVVPPQATLAFVRLWHLLHGQPLPPDGPQTPPHAPDASGRA